MKKRLFLFMLVFVMAITSGYSRVLHAEQILSPGDIAIIQYRTDNTEGFTFVTFVDIAPGTKIHFTDKGWDGSELRSGENVWTWAADTSLTRGNVVSCQGNSCTSGDLDPPIDGGLSGDGDQLITFQGTIKSPTFIYALSTTEWILTGEPTTHTSYLPAGLINDVTAIDFGTHIDNGYFNITSLTDTRYAILQEINPENNWNRANSSSHPFQPPSYWSFNFTGPFISTSPSDPRYIMPPILSGVENDPRDPAKILGIDLTISDPNATVTPTKQEVPGQPGVKPFADPTLELTEKGTAWNLKITPKDNTKGYAIITVTAEDNQGNTDATFILYAASTTANNPDNARFHTGASDASTAIVIDENYMFVGNDEDEVIRLYHRNNSGLPIIDTFDFHEDLDVVKEVDIEASTRVGDLIYWIGSHGNDREGNSSPDRNRLFATRISGSGASATMEYVGRYDGLRDNLKAWGDEHGYHFTEGMAPGKNPIEPDGFNIEGLTMAPNNTTAYIAFRAPLVPVSNRTKALIAPVTNLSDLVSDNPSSGPAQIGDPIELDLGGLPIRSIERNASNQYLILAGGPGDDNNFQLFTWTGNPDDTPKLRITNPNLITLNEGQPTGGYESFLMPDNLNEDTLLHLLVDNGRANWYGDDSSVQSKKFHANFQKFRRDAVTQVPIIELTSDNERYTLDTPYNFIATVTSPASTPITYYWTATDHDPIEHESDSSSDPVQFTWSTYGEKTINLTFESADGGRATLAHAVNVTFFMDIDFVLDCPGLGWKLTLSRTRADCTYEIHYTNSLLQNKWLMAAVIPGENGSTVWTDCGGPGRNFDLLTQLFYRAGVAEDPDGDGLSSYYEEIILGGPDAGYDPDSSDTDGDAVPDGDEDLDGDGRTNMEEYQTGTDPCDPNTDGDGKEDFADNFPLDPSAWFDNDADGKPDQTVENSISKPLLEEDDQYELTIAMVGQGTGKVTASAETSTGTITREYNAGCTEAYYDNTEVTLTATPDPGSIFAGWIGEGCSGTESCIISITHDQLVTANFAVPFNIPPGDVDALIEAINTANSRDGDDIINLGVGTYILTQKTSEWSGANGLPLITSNIKIIGTSNPDDTIINVSEDGYGDMRVFAICRGATVSLQGLSITGGGPDSGGAIRNDATLFITDCVISGNVAKDGSGGGIYNARGTLIMNECIVSHNSADEGNGGGIYSSGGKVMITNSSICGNSMIEDHGGGGIYIEENGILIIDSSTICYNVAEPGAGGGGILADHGSVIITNSTIANNHASRGGGIQNEGSSVSITNTTISGNEAWTAGGIDNEGQGILEIRNTILAGNFGGHNPDCFGHPITSLGNNLIGNVSVQCDIDLLASDIIGDPGLCEFIDDGRPGKGHFPLHPRSQAIDAGKAHPDVDHDQLGTSRPVDGNGDGDAVCDIGAIEYVPIVNGLFLQPEELLTTSFNPDPVANAPAGTFTITATFTNKSSSPHILNPFFKVAELSGGNLLLNADGGAGGVGATLTPDVGDDGVLSPAESFTVDFVIGLQTRNRFRFFVDLLGVPSL